MVRIIVAGGRDFDDAELLYATMDAVTAKHKRVTVLHGCAKGADRLGEKWTKARGHKYERYPANWHRFKKAAGPIRNEEMAKRAEMLVAFWDGASPGTADMIQQARKYGLKIKVVRYGDNLQKGLLF